MCMKARPSELSGVVGPNRFMTVRQTNLCNRAESFPPAWGWRTSSCARCWSRGCRAARILPPGRKRKPMRWEVIYIRAVTIPISKESQFWFLSSFQQFIWNRKGIQFTIPHFRKKGRKILGNKIPNLNHLLVDLSPTYISFPHFTNSKNCGAPFLILYYTGWINGWITG